MKPKRKRPITPPAPPEVLKLHKCKSQLQWRKLKRKQLDALRESLNDYIKGCYFAPMQTEVMYMAHLVRRLKEALKEENWV